MWTSSDLHFRRTWTLLRPLFFHFPGYISTGEVKVHSARDFLSKNFGACRCSESVFVGAKKDLAIPRLRVKPKQGPKRPAMHHTEAVMVIWSKNQGVNIVAPYCWIFTPVQLILSGCAPSNPTGSAQRPGRGQKRLRA
jgi:hypothetical protein